MVGDRVLVDLGRAPLEGPRGAGEVSEMVDGQWDVRRRVSRTGLPFSQVSATANISRFASMASAMRLRTAAALGQRCVAQASLAAWAASSANSTSSTVDRATSQNGFPLTGLTLAMY